MEKPKRVLVLGSGSLKIGEAGEFDYSGSQCLKALKEEGIKTVLVNPNIATVQTNEGLADKIYFLPVTPYFVEKIIEKEKPDSILLGFGGQTALNCGVELANAGVFEKYGIRVLGTSIEAIKNTEDRALFVKKLDEIGLKTPRSEAAYSTEEALGVAKKLGFPMMLRVAYALGGQGSGPARDEAELMQKAKRAFAYSKQILVEEYLGGWKEIEYEVVRDSFDNCITVCNMENFDPMGIHTGESIVVAPSQTLTNREYHMLREISIKLIRHLNIVGECNVQFALDPNSEDYRIIEVNARLSRSSALASKATGYPLAFVAAKLAIGYSLADLQNSVTRTTMACFEPALDYVVVKMPRWDLQKFVQVSTSIGSEMKSVGEVMAIGRKFEEAIQKAVRMLNIGFDGLAASKPRFENFESLENELSNPTDKRLFAIVDAIKLGFAIEKIHALTKIDFWFLQKVRNIIETEKEIQKYGLKSIPMDLLRLAKQQGFSDLQIAKLLLNTTANLNTLSMQVRNLRKDHGIIPVVKQIDTLAAEYYAKTNYLYLTYNGEEDDVAPSGERNIIVLGSGPYKIGSSVEFDWCCVNTIFALKKLGYNATTINYNPETVSTDYDVSDRLYFDELAFERILDIYEKENPHGLIISMGGQIPNNLAMKLQKNGVRLLGTSAESIDKAEDRHKFSAMLDRLKVSQPAWTEAKSIVEVHNFAQLVGYPVLIRPSYVLSGAAMSIASNKDELGAYLDKAADVSPNHTIVITKFISGAKEAEIDAVAKSGKILIHAISEHIENAGVHSGDATIILPTIALDAKILGKIKSIAKKISAGLNITGPFNIQFLVKGDEVRVIECNLRASRSFPFVSKVTKQNFITIATKAILGLDVKAKRNVQKLDYFGVKAPQFSFSRLRGADPILGVEMASTGEVACFGNSLQEAFLKSLLSTGLAIPHSSILLSTGPLENKEFLLDSVRKLVTKGFKICATGGTAKFLDQNGISCETLNWPLDKAEPNVLTYVKERKIDLIINIPKNYEEQELQNDYLIRRTAVDFNIPLITNANVAKLFVDTICEKKVGDLLVKEYGEYK